MTLQIHNLRQACLSKVVFLILLVVLYIVAGVHISHGGFNDQIGPDNWGSPNDHGERNQKVLKTVVDCCRPSMYHV